MRESSQTKDQQKPLTKASQRLNQRILDCLVKDDFALLDIICHGSLAGDSAATASKGILCILESFGTETVERYLRQLVRTRVNDYIAKSKDIADITRDNSLVPMLLVEYERKVASAYLVQILAKPLSEVFNKLQDCEMDPQRVRKKLGPNATDEQVEAKVQENTQNLEQVCQVLFAHILNSKTKLPVQVGTMCGFLAKIVEENLHNPSVISDLRRKKTAKELETSLLNARESTKGLSHVPTLRATHTKEEDSSGYLVSTPVKTMLKLNSELLEKGPMNTPPQNRKSFGDVLDSPSKQKLVRPIASLDNLKIDTGMTGSIASQSDTSTPVFSPGGNVGTLTTSDKVVGSFLFLRFIVPAITTPEHNGIVLSKISPDDRRGLVLCGKMVTALCNDLDFGHKELSLIPCNAFLKQYRIQMKEFLTKCLVDTNDSPHQSLAFHKVVKKSLSASTTDLISTTPNSHTRQLSQPIGKLKNNKVAPQTKAMSLNNLTQVVSKEVSTNEQVISAFETLYKQIDKIEKDFADMNPIVKQMDAKEALEKFAELKNLLLANYAQSDSPMDRGKKRKWWDKFWKALKI